VLLLLSQEKRKRTKSNKVNTEFVFI